MIFVSATTQGLSAYRRLVRDVLQAQGFEVAVHETFTTPNQPIIRHLQEGLGRCRGIIALVGDYYGRESPAACRVNGSRLSYTQYELEFALHQGLKTLVLIADPDSQADTDTKAAMPAEPKEKTALQAAFIERVKGLPRGLGCLPFRTREDLALILAKTDWRDWRC